MTDLKPKIFIGSSTDGYDTAKKVKDFLSVAADCYLWQDSDVWEPNMSTFDNLLRMDFLISGYLLRLLMT